MGVDKINTSGEFKITRENVEKILDNLKDMECVYLDDLNDDCSIREVFQKMGWEIKSSRQEGVTEVWRACEGWVCADEFNFFQKLAPYIENGSFIEFELIYGEAYYDKWSFEDGKLIYYTGEQVIKWIKNDKPNYDR